MTQNLRSRPAARRRLPRPRRDGLSDGRPSRARAGHRVTVYNRTAAKAAQWVARARRRERADAGRGGSRRRLRLRLRRQRRRPALGDARRRRRLRRHASRRDLRRPHHGLGRSRARAAERRRGRVASRFIDAPVSGGNLGAVNGALTVMCGGDAAAFAEAQPVAMAFAKAMTLLGAERLGPARQDGQPDRDRRSACRACPKRSRSASEPGST